MKRTNAEFEEETFAYAATLELAAGTTAVFTPGRVLEAILSFDTAVRPSAPWVWSAIGAKAKRGLTLHPGTLAHWRGVPLPRFPHYFVSLFLQHKRPTYSSSTRARHFAFYGGPYFEFAVRPGQHQRLQALENAVRSHAVTRYASPAFWKSSELFRHQIAASVINNTAFVGPSRINGTHTRWTYAGPGRKGLANPEPERIDPESWEGLTATLARSSERQTLVEHIRDIADQLRRSRIVDDAPLLRNVEQSALAEKLGSSGAVLDFLTIDRAAANADADWSVIGLEGADGRQLFVDRTAPGAWPLAAWLE